MSHNGSSDSANNNFGGSSTTRNHRSRRPLVVAIAALGGLALAVGAVDSSATADTQEANESRVNLAPPVKPPTGMVWLQGKLTDQAGHGLDNVNVEVWSDAGAIEPAASNLTYGGSPADGRHGHGAYRVEVPEGVPYTLVFSAVGGEEDGDAFRMQAYGQGRPIMTLGKAAAAGTVRNLGTTELVHQGKVRSKVTALRPAKVKAGKRGTVKIKVTSPFVAPVTGKLVVRVDGRKVTDKLATHDGGKTTVRLPKLKPGTYKISASYAGTKTVQKSSSAPVKLTVKNKK